MTPAASKQKSTEKIVVRFLGGSLVASPATSFRNKNNEQVDLPDRLILRCDGDEMQVSVTALDALKDIESKNERLAEFLAMKREQENAS
jgi:hypothetical protein